MKHEHNCAPDLPGNCLSTMLKDSLPLHCSSNDDGIPDRADLHIKALYRRFVWAAIAITLTFGTFWGVSILTMAAMTHSFTAPEPSQIQAHAHAQVFGWIGLLIMGVSYFAYPKIKKVPLRTIARAEASFWFMTSGIVIRAIAQPFAAHPAGGIAVGLSALLEILAGGLFVSVMYGIYLRALEKRTVSDMFIFSAGIWLVVALIQNLVSMISIARTGDPVIPAGWNLSRMNAEVFGFIASMILGMAAQLLPGLLGVREIPRRAGIASAILFGAGVFAKVIAAPPVIGSSLLVAAVIIYIVGLDVFMFNTDSKKKHNPLRPWVSAAFFWLLFGASMMLGGDMYAALTGQAIPHVWVGAYRHAVAVGFITTMAVGMAHLTVPLFHGAPLYSARLMWTAFWLLQVGNACRVIFQTLTLTKNPIIYGMTGMSGYLELTALILFGCNIICTFRRPASQFFSELVVRKTTALGEFCTAFPDAKPALAKLGLMCDRKGSDVCQQMSVSAAAKHVGLSPELVIERLNRHINQSRSKPLTITALF